jgi:DNA-binding NtrC family response regulator
VRELENVLQRALVLSSGGKIMAGDIMVDGALQEAASTEMTTATMLQQSATA